MSHPVIPDGPHATKPAAPPMKTGISAMMIRAKFFESCYNDNNGEASCFESVASGDARCEFQTVRFTRKEVYHETQHQIPGTRDV